MALRKEELLSGGGLRLIEANVQYPLILGHTFVIAEDYLDALIWEYRRTPIGGQ